MGEQTGGNGVSGSYMKAFLPGLVIGLVAGGFGGAYLVPMMSGAETVPSAHPGPRPSTAVPMPDQDQIQERPEQAGAAKPDEAKPADAKPEEKPAEKKEEAKPAEKPVEPPKWMKDAGRLVRGTERGQRGSTTPPKAWERSGAGAVRRRWSTAIVREAVASR